MTISAQLKAFQAALETWAQSERAGHCHLANDPVEMFEILSQRPGSTNIVLMFKDESPLGAAHGLQVSRRFVAVISRGKGFALKPGADLVDGQAGQPALYDLLSDAVKVIEGVAIAPTPGAAPGRMERCPHYLGTRLFEFAGQIITDAYQIDFSLATCRS